MSLQIPRLVEAIKNRSRLQGSAPILDEMASIVELSHKFSLSSDLIPDNICKGAAQYARQLFSHGIMPLPFDSCTFEFAPKGLKGVISNAIPVNSAVWVLIWKVPRLDKTCGWGVYFRVFIGSHVSAAVHLVPGLCQIFTDAFENTGEHGYFELMGSDKSQDSAFRKHMLNRANAMGEVEIYTPNIADADAYHFDMMKFGFEQSLILLGLLSTSQGVVISKCPVLKPWINSKRIKNGKTPMEYEHVRVCIDPSLLRLPGVVAQGGSHASPRLHWRRGHIRTLPNGNRTQIKPCIVGDASRGSITHDYVVKMPLPPLSECSC